MDALRRKIRPVPAGKYLLGFSGGADSVALLLMLLPGIREGRLSVEAVHVNHGLRGSEADEDEAFCSGICAREGIPLHIRRVNLNGKRDEASAREARFEAFRRL